MSISASSKLWGTLALCLAGLAGACADGRAPEVESTDGAGGADVRRCDAGPGDTFERRIEPLLSTDHPDTCAQCHAGGVKLSDYLRGDACESMACLIDQGLVNLEQPEASALLSFVDRAAPDNELITADVIRAERTGLLDWISHEAECGGCADVQCPDASAAFCSAADELGAFDINSDPGGCEQETLEKLFRGTVYEKRSRCTPCHFAGSPEELAPLIFSERGTCQVAALATLRRIEEAGYLDTEDGLESRLLLKPLAEFQGGLPHGGHDKLTEKNDSAYTAFTHFLIRYAECR